MRLFLHLLKRAHPSVCLSVVRFEAYYKHATTLFEAIIIIGLFVYSNRVRHSRSRALGRPSLFVSFLSCSVHYSYQNSPKQVQTAGGGMRSPKTPAAGGSAQVNSDSPKELCFKRAPVRRRDIAESGSRVLRLSAGSLASFSLLLSFSWISPTIPGV